MTLDETKKEAHERFLDAQSIYRLTCSDIFQLAYSKATPEEKEKLRSIRYPPELRKYLRFIIRNELESLSIKELRKLGRKYDILNYATLAKVLLIEEIQNAQRKIANLPSGNEAAYN